MVGRGASSPKGPLVAWINSLEAMIKTDSLPVNVMMLIEGEEILGSPNYPAMFQRYRNRLEKADAAFAGGMTQGGTGGVSINLGFRGFLVLELEVSGERWGRGPIGMSMHSSLKNVIDNPASRLTHVVSSLTDETGDNIRLRGIEEAILPPSEEDKELINALVARHGEGGIKAALGLAATATMGDIVGSELLMGYLYKPSLNVNGLYSGFIGPGAEVFTVPERAVARLDLRLPPGLTCERTLAALDEHLKENGFDDVEVRVLAAHDWSRTPVDSDIIQAVIDTYQQAGLEAPVWPYKGGGGPWSLFRSELGLPLVMAAGLGGGGRRDRGDEYLIIDGHPKIASLLDSEKSHIDIVNNFATR